MLTKLGWKVIRVAEVLKGSMAIKIEGNVLAKLVLLGAKIGHVPKARMPRGGHTETIGMDSISRSSLTKVFNQETQRTTKKSL
jgi:hypothetical protein